MENTYWMIAIFCCLPIVLVGILLTVALTSAASKASKEDGMK